MKEFLFKHKTAIIITLIAAVFAVITVVSLINAQPSDSVLTVAFVDAAGCTSGSCERIARSFDQNARDAYESTYNNPSYATPGAVPHLVLQDSLLGQSADLLILDQVTLELLAKADLLLPLTPEDPAYAQTLNGICYGFIIDGADLTGSMDIISGYKAPDAKDSQFFCAAVLKNCNNKELALSGMKKLEQTLISQLNKENNG